MPYFNIWITYHPSQDMSNVHQMIIHHIRKMVSGEAVRLDQNLEK